ncbi:hypothetical protein QR721_08545 [Aciduricibacillus chroicocephali]|uniref:Uncharacterized protein n=1 Tax=Aciduricibacillus chroicocephali TaxID=3054939 RepID=A0ABY9KS91_9BACI|nr:hypothetical protein QR721_08545 [Bacillaceae bacterium 44XB]
MEKFLFNLNETARLLKEFEEEEITKKYETEGGKNEHLLWDASNYMSENEGRLNAYISEVPENLVSWNGGVFVDIRNKIKQNGEEESNQVLKDILNFKKGYDAEAGSINVYKEPYKALAIMEDVLSSKKYMGNRFIYKDR